MGEPSGATRDSRIVITLLIAAAAWGASWFLPVMEDLPGWMAFRYAMAAVVTYKGVGPGMTLDDAGPQVVSALTNAMFVALWLLVWMQRGRMKLILRGAIGCFAVNLYWFVQLMRELKLTDLWIGYYAWLAAFAALALAAWFSGDPSDRRTSRTPTADKPT